mmetsp:Transcript_24073/g.62029  ORF Transcript_24073/g.62029 Transcript_24073/m.62029 type:complete len:208 (+) Transcript_24073:827-1450(+)
MLEPRLWRVARANGVQPGVQGQVVPAARREPGVQRRVEGAADPKPRAFRGRGAVEVARAHRRRRLRAVDDGRRRALRQRADHALGGGGEGVRGKDVGRAACSRDRRSRHGDEGGGGGSGGRLEGARSARAQPRARLCGGQPRARRHHHRRGLRRAPPSVLLAVRQGRAAAHPAACAERCGSQRGRSRTGRAGGRVVFHGGRGQRRRR